MMLPAGVPFAMHPPRGRRIKMRRMKCLPACATIICISASVTVLHAAEPSPYPSRSVRMVVPFAPGGSDIVARMLTPKLSEKLGQAFVVDNKPGAASVLGSDIVAKAAPDGYTLLFCTASLAATAASNKKLPYDPVRDFDPIAQVGTVPFVLVTHPSLPVKTVREFIALAKRRPGEMMYSSAGTGGIGHLVVEYFAKEAGFKVTHVPYKGTGPSITALLSGEVQFAMPNISGALGIVRANKVRTLGVAAERRLSFAPDLLTMRELGFDLVAGPWYAMVAPRGTRPDIIELLNREVSTMVTGTDMGDKLAARGMVVETRTPQSLANYIKSEIDKWRGVMRAAGLQPQ
jgi:tripartite-type tricarboxylate transporter receptor subunit TctC